MRCALVGVHAGSAGISMLLLIGAPRNAAARRERDTEKERGKTKGARTLLPCGKMSAFFRRDTRIAAFFRRDARIPAEKCLDTRFYLRIPTFSPPGYAYKSAGICTRTRRNFRRDTQKKNVSRRSSAGICVFPAGYGVVLPRHSYHGAPNIRESSDCGAACVDVFVRACKD